MLIKSLHLKNIRSYVDQTITFPDGSLMLSGDIGAGKSTVLLAIEFALFGLLKSDLSGGALLRHGTKQGTVELRFELDGEEFTIARALKRSKDRVEQEAGWIARNNGQRQSKTAMELKSAVLDLLGYPKELVTKSKSLMYRYTVYTPQEEMKRILFDTAESRLNVLRKVFDIDKYRRVRENASGYARVLRERKRSAEGFIRDLEEKRIARQHKQTELQETQSQLHTMQPQLKEVQQKATTAQAQLTQLESQLKQTQIAAQELRARQTRLESTTQEEARAQQEATALVQAIAQLEQSLAKMKVPEDLQAQIQQVESAIVAAEQALREHTVKNAEVQARKKEVEMSIQRVRELATCPQCLQAVPHEHKEAIAQREQSKLAEHDQQIQHHTTSLQQKEQELTAARKAREGLRELEKQAMLVQQTQHQLQEKRARHAQLEQRKQQLLAEQQQLKQQIQQLEPKVKESAAVESRLAEVKKQALAVQGQESELRAQFSGLDTKVQMITKAVQELQQEITKKEEAKQGLAKLSAIEQWLTEHFAVMAEGMERAVMVTVWHEFNALFTKWFGLLIEDELLSARLDESFTPVMQQNGFDTDLTHLSGGERTACALAYRLALNKVINDLISTISTKNLIILDEPTDGFSHEQLDKMRDVLEELALKQVIIVSHEPKIESFVQHVIRVNKDEHISTIETA